MKLRFGILGCAAIARRMMLPAMAEVDAVELRAVAARDVTRAQAFAAEFGCRAEASYEALLASPDIDAVYLPLPPALHETWALRALAAGKHVLCEKPLATERAAAERMVAAARAADRVLAENWMFLHHRQWAEINEWVNSGTLGALRMVRASFGFPPLDADNFRYRAELGGGALLDAGGYTLCAARHFLGADTRVLASTLHTPPGSSVDRFGSGLLLGPNQLPAQIAFGFDSHYQCELQLWFADGMITAPRIFTAPPGFAPSVSIATAHGVETRTVAPDNHFAGMLRDFVRRIETRQRDDSGLLQQTRLLEEFRQQCQHCM